MPPAENPSWPSLPLEAWQDTYATLHMWTQVVGKVRMALTPPLSHFWHCTLYVTPRGLTTSTMRQGDRLAEMRFDFFEHQLIIETSGGPTKHVKLEPRTVADFYAEVMAALKELGFDVRIHAKPDEVANPIPFAKDTVHASYDAEYAQRFWRILASVDSVCQEFRSGFLGKSSPVHFFWGSFDMAVTRFSGRRAPERPGADAITREAYSHEVISGGFWPGGGNVKGPTFYAYAAPEPSGFAEQRVRPAKAFYDTGMKEFLLMYDDVRASASPREDLRAFLESTYAAGADLGGWDRKALEKA
ncbi:MAG: DUF5996 family protein [Terriglobales bacterium]